jgi:flavin reductase (DIM6/NTAB) family NADH-FMN oxidoreductase RutF
MAERHESSFWECTSEILNRMRAGGVLCTVVDNDGRQNLLTLGWGQIGPFYHGHPVFSIAVSPLRHSWRFLAEVPEFVIAVPGETLRAAAKLCGTASGRDLDKFAAAGLTRVPSVHVRAPSIVECAINIECRIYASIAPPHLLLTPEHRQQPIEAQHTIYFAEVLAAYTYAGCEGDAGRSTPG